MQRFAVFVEELQEEMDAELIEYAAYIGIHHPAASGVAGKKMAASRPRPKPWPLAERSGNQLPVAVAGLVD